MRPVVTAAQMRAIDAETIDSIGLPGALLMENAGRAVAGAAREMLATVPEARVGILCGAGNNGGDGFVAARVLQEHGVAVELFACVPLASLVDDARLHADAFLRCGGLVITLDSADDLRLHRQAILDSDLLIDALFGTGLRRDIEGHLAEVITVINQSRARVLAIDLPSGLRADDGATLGVSVRADRTISMAFAKVANVGAPGFEANGTLTVAEIGIPLSLARQHARVGIIERDDVRAYLGRFAGNTHKGQRGHVLAIAGSPGKRGAGRLCALAALRGGAGLVTLAATSPDERAESSLMTARVSDATTLRAQLANKAALLIGPGMSTKSEGADLVRLVLQDCQVPMVFDADALNHVGNELDLFASANAPLLLTPHPGEAARLLGSTSAEVQSDRIAAVRELAARSRSVVLLKGARTCICDGRAGSDFVFINPTGGPELSTAGTGDVLAGVLVALLAQGIEAGRAAQTAAYWHGEAGRLALSALGGCGVIASDVLSALPRARTAIAGAWTEGQKA